MKNGNGLLSRNFRLSCGALKAERCLRFALKGNADTERMMRTLKEELCWLHDWQSVDELKTALDAFIEDFNDGYLHSALGYKTPNAFEKEHFEHRRATLNLAA
jgi:hypothetical protein